VGLDDSPLMGRAVIYLNASGNGSISLIRDEVVEVMEFGSSSDQWAWKVKTTDGRIGITRGSYLFPMKKKYQYSSKARMSLETITDYSDQLKFTAGQIIEVDKSFYPKWRCLPARMNGVEGFVFAKNCEFI